MRHRDALLIVWGMNSATRTQYISPEREAELDSEPLLTVMARIEAGLDYLRQRLRREAILAINVPRPTYSAMCRLCKDVIVSTAPDLAEHLPTIVNHLRSKHGSKLTTSAMAGEVLLGVFVTSP